MIVVNPRALRKTKLQLCVDHGTGKTDEVLSENHARLRRSGLRDNRKIEILFGIAKQNLAQFSEELQSRSLVVLLISFGAVF